MSKLNVRNVMRIYTDYMEEYSRGLIGFTPGKGVMITTESMGDVAPISNWNLNQPYETEDGTVYYSDIRIDGVLFYVRTLSPIEVSNDPAAQS